MPKELPLVGMPWQVVAARVASVRLVRTVSLQWEEEAMAAALPTALRRRWSAGGWRWRKFRTCRTVWRSPWLAKPLRRAGAWRSGPRPAKLAARTVNNFESSAPRPRQGEGALRERAAAGAVAAATAAALETEAETTPEMEGETETLTLTLTDTLSPTSECDRTCAWLRPKTPSVVRGAAAWLRERCGQPLHDAKTPSPSRTALPRARAAPPVTESLPLAASLRAPSRPSRLRPRPVCASVYRPGVRGSAERARLRVEASGMWRAACAERGATSGRASCTRHQITSTQARPSRC